MLKVSLAACICAGQFWLRKQQVFWFRAAEHGWFFVCLCGFPTAHRRKPLSLSKCRAELIHCQGFIAKGQFTSQDNAKDS